ncbi:MAG: hypothetical protein DRQ60_10270 [Gammaproteobacteria bacterium]|nr:MAG: hypothetical protein DRQ60_10270 [Gammaproteobacteria bacterium]
MCLFSRGYPPGNRDVYFLWREKFLINQYKEGSKMKKTLFGLLIVAVISLASGCAYDDSYNPPQRSGGGGHGGHSH